MHTGPAIESIGFKQVTWTVDPSDKPTFSPDQEFLSSKSPYFDLSGQGCSLKWEVHSDESGPIANDRYDLFLNFQEYFFIAKDAIREISVAAILLLRGISIIRVFFDTVQFRGLSYKIMSNVHFPPATENTLTIDVLIFDFHHEGRYFEKEFLPFITGYLRNMETLRTDFLSMMKKEESDVQIIVNGDVFKVHKNVVSCRNKVLERAIESDMQEKASGQVILKDTNSIAVRAFLSYIYTGVYDITKDPFGLFKLAHLLGADEVYTACEIYLSKNLTLSNIIRILELASVDEYHLKILEPLAWEFIDSHGSVLSTNPEFLECVVDYISIDNIPMVLKFADTHHLDELFKKAAEFVRTHLDQILKDKMNEEFLTTQGKLLLKIFKYSTELFAAWPEQVKESTT